MITLITGAPGAGKSAALVDLISKLSKDRAVYASGIPDFTVPHEVLEKPEEWPNTVPDGSIIVIDEAQRIWRPRGPGSKVPPDIAALETHRHRGLDFYLVTQSPRLIDSNVRGLVGRHIHLREIGVLGRWWYEWPEVSDNCANSWKTAPFKRRFRLPKGAFSLYKSSSLHVKPIRSFPTMLLVLFAAITIVAYLSYRAYQSIAPKIVAPEASKLVALSEPGAKFVRTSTPTTERALIDDRVDWIPRVSNRPESAPAYDHLRQVVAMPLVVGGMCIGNQCRCINQQGSDSGLSSNDCKTWILNPPFDPYRVTVSNVSGPDAASGRTQSNASHAQNVSAPVASSGVGSTP